MFDNENSESTDQTDEESQDQTEEGVEAGQDSDEDQTSGEEESTIEINGEKLTIEELKRGYMREADYRKKTQELARQKTIQPREEDNRTEEEKRALEVLDKLGVAKKGDVENLVRTLIIQEKMASEKSRVAEQFGLDEDVVSAAQFMAMRSGITLEEAAKKLVGKQPIPKKSLGVTGGSTGAKEAKGSKPTLEEIRKMDPNSKEFMKVQEMLEKGEL